MEFLLFFFLMSMATLAAIVILIWRYLRYRETIALAERGLIRPRSQDENGRGALRSGIFFTFFGIALMIGTYPIGWSTSDVFLFRMGPWMLPGLLFTAIGLAQLVIYLLTRHGEEHPNGGGAALSAGEEMGSSESAVPRD